MAKEFNKESYDARLRNYRSSHLALQNKLTTIINMHEVANDCTTEKIWITRDKDGTPFINLECKVNIK